MADFQMYVDAGGLEDNFDPDLVFQNEIIPTGGSVTINGPVDTGFAHHRRGRPAQPWTAM